jgi:hypothetical protein
MKKNWLVLSALSFSLLQCGSGGGSKDAAPAPQEEPGVKETGAKETGTGSQQFQLSRQDGCGWSFEIEPDATMKTSLLQNLSGYWIADYFGYDPKSKSVPYSTGFWTDPDTKLEYVNGTGYQFHEEGKRRGARFLFDRSATSGGYPLKGTEGETEFENFVVGKLIGDTGYRPMEILGSKEDYCPTILFKMIDEQTLEIRGYKHRDSSEKNEPDISDYLDESDGGVGSHRYIRVEL